MRAGVRGRGLEIILKGKNFEFGNIISKTK
jgi:hypothetical protein